VTDFDQFEAERLEFGEYAIKRSLVGEQTRQHGVVAPRLGLEVRERAAHHLAQATADTDLVTLRLRIATGSGHILTAQEAAHQSVAAPGMTRLMAIPPYCLGPSVRASTSTG
jgi:hypothetical protein